MSIGLVTLDLTYPMVHSLKEKRRIIQSFFSKVRKTFNVAVAEIDCQDLWQRSIVGMVTINSSKSELQRTLDYIVNFVQQNDEIQMINYRIEIE